MAEFPDIMVGTGDVGLPDISDSYNTMSQWNRPMQSQASYNPNQSSSFGLGNVASGIGSGLSGIFGSLGSLFSGGNSQQGGGLNLGGILGTLGNAYLGYQGLKQADKEFDFQKDSFNRQYAAQKQLINNELANSRDYYLRSHNRDMSEEERKAAVDAYVAEKGVS